MTPFQFKKFTVAHDKCAMKIGTDSVLLGAWTSVKENPMTVLDIGAGSGILSLMIAQRSNAQKIEALEIDEEAYEQCIDNFENSVWNDRLFCYHASLLEFIEEVNDSFDLLICNPPFYTEDYKTNNSSRNLARFNDAMPLKHLIYAAFHLLSKTGLFSIIIPKKEEVKFIALATEIGLYPKRILHVKGSPESEIKRSLIECSFSKAKIEITELIIETSRHNYTKDYITLTKDFYLNM